MSAKYFYEPGKPHQLPHDPLNAIIGPRPIGWISSRGAGGEINLAPYSFFNAFNYKPPIIGFASIGAKDSLRNIESSREFVWNLVTFPLIERMNASSAMVPYGENEFRLSGLTEATSRMVAAPAVAEAGVNFECKLTQILQLQNHEGRKLETWLVLGQVVGVHINENLLGDGVFKTFDAEIVLRAGGPGDYSIVRPESYYELRRQN